jgi:squalene synthase HpnC
MASVSTESPMNAANDWAALPQYAMPADPPPLAEAQAYCRHLARTHYENFSVATWFLPRRLHQHFYNLYAYCRISDDLGDEVGNAQRALRLLDAWQAELDTTYLSLLNTNALTGGTGAATRNPARPTHPVFVALRETIRELDIPRQPFADLLTAFRRDQVVQRYETFQDVLGYCRYSANPVGRLVLYLCGYRDPERQRLSDFTCTALQLANFWQDVKVDWGKGRVYLPLEDLRKYNVSEDLIASGRTTPEFIELMKFEVARAREWFELGLPLARQVDKELALDIELFTRGGQEILNAIERQGYDVLRSRPAISKIRKLALVLKAATRKLF